MKTRFRWGILGPGSIARKFAMGLRAIKDAEIAAVASRSPERAAKFAQEFSVLRSYGSYAELANDPGIDAIYIATPHSHHHEHSILCLTAGKAVLCEKPLTVNAQQAAEVIAVARSQRVFLMDAMWTRFLPIYETVRRWLREGAIGEVRLLRADCGFWIPWSPEDRRFNPQLAGGALLDLGVYPLTLASLLFQSQPERVESIAYIGPTGVDEQCSMLLGYKRNQLAVLSCAVNSQMTQEAWICGTGGKIRIPDFWRATRAILIQQGREDTTEERSFKANGYEYEAAEVMRCIRSGKLESESMPLYETLAVIQTLEQVRTRWD